MKFKWFKNKKSNRPEFWNDYVDAFKSLHETPLKETKFIIFDTETTGIDIKKDRILSIGAISSINNTISVSDSFELYLEQAIFSSETVKIHGLLKNGNLKKVSELEAIKQFLKYIETSVLVGHHIGFDIGIINQMLLRHNLGKLQNKRLDTGTLFRKSKHEVYKENLKHYSLDDLCEELKVQKIDRHTASGDALITAIVFLKIIARLNKKNKLTLKSLFK